MAAVSKFPLLQLPDKVILRTIRMMNLDEIFGFSLLSKICKKLAASLKIKSYRTSIWIDNKITVVVRTRRREMLLDFYTEPNMYWGAGEKKKLTAPESVLVHFIGKPIGNEKWAKNDFEMSDWLEHIYTVFNCFQLGSIKFGRGSNEFDIDDVKETFRIKDELLAAHTGCFEYNQMIFRRFQHVEQLCIENNMFQDSRIAQNILMRNLTAINVGYHTEEPIVMTLNDLLANNIRTILIKSVRISPKVLNKFIKLWMQGANPHMEYMELFYMDRSGVSLESTVMKGIKHNIVIRPRSMIPFFKADGLDDITRVFGKIDIYRNDGIRATLDAGWDIFTMAVWFDHCVV